MTDEAAIVTSATTLHASLRSLDPSFPAKLPFRDGRTAVAFLISACQHLVVLASRLQTVQSATQAHVKAYSKRIKELESENAQLLEDRGNQGDCVEDDLTKHLIVNVLKKNLAAKEKSLLFKDREITELRSLLLREGDEAAKAPTRADTRSLGLQSGLAYFLLKSASAQTESESEGAAVQTEEALGAEIEGCGYTDTVDTSQQYDPIFDTKLLFSSTDGQTAGRSEGATQTAGVRCASSDTQTQPAELSLESLPTLKVVPRLLSRTASQQTTFYDKPSDFGYKRLYTEKTIECEDLHQILLRSLPVSPEQRSLMASKPASRRSPERRVDELCSDCSFFDNTVPASRDTASVRLKAKEASLCELTECLKARERTVLYREQMVRRKELELEGALRPRQVL